VSIIAGSRVLTSCWMGKRSVWSVARLVGGAPPFAPFEHAASRSVKSAVHNRLRSIFG